MKAAAMKKLNDDTVSTTRWLVRMPLEEAHQNHPVGPLSAMGKIQLKPEIKEKIADLVSRGTVM